MIHTVLFFLLTLSVCAHTAFDGEYVLNTKIRYYTRGNKEVIITLFTDAEVTIKAPAIVNLQEKSPGNINITLRYAMCINSNITE